MNLQIQIKEYRKNLERMTYLIFRFKFKSLHLHRSMQTHTQREREREQKMENEWNGKMKNHTTPN